jgi:DNA-binding NarL/FixJ family response regulator
MDNKTVLVLDENTMVHETLGSALSSRSTSFHVIHESDPKRYLNSARLNKPDIILLSNADQNNEYSVLKALRSLPLLKNKPVILLAAQKDKLNAQVLRSLNISKIARKPFQSNTIVKIIQETLSDSFSGYDPVTPMVQEADQTRDIRPELKEVSAEEINMRPVKAPTTIKRIDDQRQLPDSPERNNKREHQSHESKSKATPKKKQTNGQKEKIDINRRMMVARYTEIRRIVLPEGSLLFTSVNSKDGTSVVATEIAMSRAQAPDRKKPILFIDLNSYHQLGASYLLEDKYHDKLPGIVDILTMKASLQACVYPTKVPNLYVIPYGNAGSNFDPVEHMPKLKRLITDVSYQYRLLIDICNLSARNRYNFDPIEVAQIIDRVMLVVLSSKTPREAILQGKIEIESYGGEIGGIIMNDYETVSFQKDMRRFLNWLKRDLIPTIKNFPLFARKQSSTG